MIQKDIKLKEGRSTEGVIRISRLEQQISMLEMGNKKIT